MNTSIRYKNVFGDCFSWLWLVGCLKKKLTAVHLWMLKCMWVRVCVCEIMTTYKITPAQLQFQNFNMPKAFFLIGSTLDVWVCVYEIHSNAQHESMMLIWICSLKSFKSEITMQIFRFFFHIVGIASFCLYRSNEYVKCFQIKNKKKNTFSTLKWSFRWKMNRMQECKTTTRWKVNFIHTNIHTHDNIQDESSTSL